MTWLSLALALVKLAVSIIVWVQQSNLIHQGKAEATLEALNNAQAFLTDAAKGANGLEFDSDWAKRVRDKYRRP